MTHIAPTLPPIKPEFDPVVKRCASELFSFTEEEALMEAMWAHGEDGNLREDQRFRPTPWGQWILSERYLANEAIYRAFHRDDLIERAASEALQEIEDEVERPCVFCPEDPRFEIRDGKICLSPDELSDQPHIEDASDLERYQTHLPLHSLKAVAASEPAGEWGSRRQEEIIETLGWVQVNLPGRGINDRMFIARIKGHSMDNGRNGLTDGAYAVFELWPKGRRDEPLAVLVRGSIADPEFGNYTLKKYQSEERDEQRERTTIRLVSLNSDKDRYPDIVLHAEDEPNLAVVAGLLEPLSPSQFSQSPKPMPPKGSRDLTSEEGRKRIEKDLAKAAERFFEAEAKEQHEAEDRSGWAARLVCLDLEAGGLYVETDPLANFPSFVKTLRVLTGEIERPVIASNLLHRIWRTPVPASNHSTRWTAPGFEGVLDEDLGRLELPGLSDAQITLFRIDTAGLGRLLSGTTVTPGQTYRVVLPPGLPLDLTGAELGSLGNGWRLWELNLPTTVPRELRETLKNLGLGFSKSTPSVQWLGALPIQYRSNAAGESYPVFEEGEAPSLRITGLETEADGELTLFVAGEGVFESIELPAGEDWWVSLQDLPSGAYVVEPVHRRTHFGRTRLPFRITDTPPPWPTGAVSLVVEDQEGDEQIYEPDENGLIEVDCDLCRAIGDEPELSIALRAPVYRRASVFWDDGKRRYISNLSLEESGELDLALALPALSDLSERNAVATLELDLWELGLVRISHRKEVTVEDLISSLRDRFAMKGSDAEKLRGQYPLLRSLWLDGILTQLYHGVRELGFEHLEDLPRESGATVLLVEETSLEAHRIVRKPRRVLVLAPDEAAVLDGQGSGLHELADKACRKVRLKEAILTNGLVWARYTPGRKVQHHPIDLREAIKEGQDSLFEQFLIQHSITV